MEMEMSMEEDDYSSDSNTDAIIYGISDPSESDESLISGPNISSSSSDDDISHQEQQQQQLGYASAPIAATDDLIASSSSSNDDISHQEQQQKISAVDGQVERESTLMIFNVDFGALSRLAVQNRYDKDIMNMASPGANYLPEFGRTPMVRQLQVTDSPFPLNAEEDSSVDEAAEAFISRFYRNLRGKASRELGVLMHA